MPAESPFVASAKDIERLLDHADCYDIETLSELRMWFKGFFQSSPRKFPPEAKRIAASAADFIGNVISDKMIMRDGPLGNLRSA